MNQINNNSGECKSSNSNTFFSAISFIRISHTSAQHPEKSINMGRSIARLSCITRLVRTTLKEKQEIKEKAFNR
jgi:hypothetical protein